MDSVRRITAVDLVVGGAFTLALQAEIWFPHWLAADTGLTQRPTLSMLSLLITVPLVARRLYPWSAGLVSLGAVAAISRMPTPPEGLADLAALLLVSYSLGRYAERPGGYLGIVPVLLVAVGVGDDGADAAFVAVVLGAAWAAGVLVGRSRDDAAALDVARRDSEQRALVADRAAAQAERRRIAAELHDVVAHRLSLIVVQCQAADAVLEADPGSAREGLAAVEQAARHALAELRQVVGVLDESESPAPESLDLSGLADLVEQARRAGVPASYEVSGEPRPVAPAVALAASRIVQEALTNVSRHASGAAARVWLHYDGSRVDVGVENDGPAVPPPAPGHGLTGMATRAAFVGGTFEATPQPGGGFSVRAALPIAQDVP